MWSTDSTNSTPSIYSIEAAAAIGYPRFPSHGAPNTDTNPWSSVSDTITATYTTDTQRKKTHRRKKWLDSHPVFKLLTQQLSHVSRVIRAPLHTPPLQKRPSFHRMTKAKWLHVLFCLFSFGGDLSVSRLQSHNKSAALSWVWTYRTSGGGAGVGGGG